MDYVRDTSILAKQYSAARVRGWQSEKHVRCRQYYCYKKIERVWAQLDQSNPHSNNPLPSMMGILRSLEKIVARETATFVRIRWRMQRHKNNIGLVNWNTTSQIRAD